MGEGKRDSSYGQAAVRLGYATEAEVQECLQIQAQLREMGLEERLGEILLRKGYVSPPHHQDILEKLGEHAELVPGYRLHDKIGGGAMGSVYRAVQTSVGRTVAIKILTPGAVRDETFVARFLQEARAVGKLSHKNLIGGIDAGEAGGLYYFVMEFVTGRNCRQILDTDGPFDEPTAIDVALQMANVLDYIQGHRFVHRDIKPENILVTPDGTVKLCDLGLAKSTVGVAPGLTQEGFAVGTPYFMSPEQIRSEPDVDIRADLYSLGASLYYLISGKRPFEGPSAVDTLTLHLKAPVPDVRKAAPHVSEGFARILRKLMAKDRADRYRRPWELTEDLKKIRTVHPTAVESAQVPVTRRVRVASRSFHRKSVAALPYVIVGAIMVAIAGAFLLLDRGPATPPAPVVARPSQPPPSPDSDPGPEAPRPAERMAKPEAEATAAELAALEAEIQRACFKEDFEHAVRLLDAVRGRHSNPEWNSELERKTAAVRASAEKAYASLKVKAIDARRRGADAEIDVIVARLSRWGYPAFVEDLRRTLAPPAAAPPVAKKPERAPPLPESQVFALFWEASVRVASDRDYGGALEGLSKTAGILKDEGARAEIVADQELLRNVEAYYAAALQVLARWPRGQRLSIEFLNEAGETQRVEEPVARTDGFRVELRREDGNLVVEAGEILAGSLAQAVRARGAKKPQDPRAAALFCLLEGDAEGARKLVEPGPVIPEKYWILGRKVAEERSRPDPRLSRKEEEARRLFYAAEREWGDFTQTFEAVGKYGVLLQRFAQSGFVRRNRPSILNRSEAGKEYFFLHDDWRASGTFRPGRIPKGDPCWTSEQDSDPARRQENCVEIGFSAMPDVEYRCWVNVGGCCMETLGFSFQAEEGTPLQPARQTIVTATPRHSSHGGQKQPSRWGWVQIPLPRYAAPGVKRIRLFTDQKGFSVAQALVSSIRSAPPRESEVKDLVKARVEAGPITRMAPSDPALVAYWKFDERAGPTARDSSRYRNHGTLANGAFWAAGKTGTALSLDGTDDHVRVSDSASLNSATVRLTVAAWVNRASDQESYRLVVSRQKGTGDDNLFWLGFVNNISAFSVTTTQGMEMTSGSPAPKGEWMHLAGTYDGTTVRLYVNGVEEAAKAQTGKIVYDGRPLLIGADQFDAEGTVQEVVRGLIDEVRIYSRALSADELADLAAGGRGR